MCFAEGEMGFAGHELAFAGHEMCFALGENEVVRGIFGYEWHEKEIWPRITRINTDGIEINLNHSGHSGSQYNRCVILCSLWFVL